MRKLLLYIYLTFCALSVSSAAETRSEFDVKLIADSLKKDAFAVVRSESTVFNYKSKTNAVLTKSLALTILDKKAKDFADFVYPSDKFHVLSNFSAKIFDANGVLLLKFKMSDVKVTEWTDSHTLIDDVKRNYFNCISPVYPFTILYDYEISYKNGILTFPAFVPQNNYNLAVEKSEYILQYPEVLKFNTKSFNIPQASVKQNNKGIVTEKWFVENLKAFEQEWFEPESEKYMPMMLVQPISFSYDNVDGNITDWKSYGDWESKLLKDRDLLTAETKQKVIDLTKTAVTDREKVKVLYDYLGETTRYVSIQLGIGGFQPIVASEVCKAGFGDCKGLTNYLKAMLDVVGVKSNYTVIRLDKTEKLLYRDFPNFQQMNHVILQVPLPKDTLWLECTNPRTPFGFVHNSISGHDALVINQDGGEICKIPDYADTLNVECFNATIVLNADGSAKSETQKSLKLKYYDNYNWFPLAKPSEQIDDLRSDINLPTAVVSQISIKEDKSALPTLDIKYVWTTPLYASKTGSRIFIPINPFRTFYEKIKKNNRKQDIFVANGFKDADNIDIILPAGFEIESAPKALKIETKFGSFNSNISIVENKINVQQQVVLNTGSWDVTDYPDFIAFFGKIATSYKSKIIIKKNE